MVAIKARRLVCFAIASIAPETFATSASALPTAPSRVSMRPTASISSAICLTAPSTAPRDAVIGGHHRLGGLLQMSETLRLVADPARDFLHVAGDVGEFDAEAADAVRKAVDQALGVRGSSGHFSKSCGLRDRHRCFPPVRD